VAEHSGRDAQRCGYDEFLREVGKDRRNAGVNLGLAVRPARRRTSPSPDLTVTGPHRWHRLPPPSRTNPASPAEQRRLAVGDTGCRPPEAFRAKPGPWRTDGRCSSAKGVPRERASREGIGLVRIAPDVVDESSDHRCLAVARTRLRPFVPGFRLPRQPERGEGSAVDRSWTQFAAGPKAHRSTVDGFGLPWSSGTDAGGSAETLVGGP
jgi:hypothetical protein